MHTFLIYWPLAVAGFCFLIAEIKAFKALRFTEKAGEIAELCCPPYDIISEEQRLEFLKKNEHNIIRLELPKGDDPYKEAANVLAYWEENGIKGRYCQCLAPP